MDLRAYYGKIRAVEDEISDPFVVVISRETADGGRRGVKSDVPRAVAARIIVDGKAELASPEEAERHRREVEQEWADWA